MRPLNLKISAFGPYAGEITIPMEMLGSQGLYLVTGDTGAGKTTIFDAICYALFGDASGNTREVSMFRSKYANADTPTEVELTFSHAGKIYTVKRNPEYMRPAKRGGGETKQTADAVLYLPDGQIVSKVKEVTSAVEGILGINREQFSQIAMLAQGDFLKLLLADTKTRAEIFRELFHTSFYQTFQYKLEDERKAVYGSFASAKESVKHFISGITAADDDVLSIEVEKAKADQLITEEILNLLDRLIEKDSAKAEQNSDLLADLDNQLETVNKRLGEAKSIENTRTALVAAKEELEKELPKLVDLKQGFESAEAALTDKEEYTLEAAKLEAEIPEYDKLETLNDELEKLNKMLAESEYKLDGNTLAEKNKREDIDRLKAELSSLENAGISKVELELRLEKDKTQKVELDTLSKKLDELTQKRERWNKSIKAYNEADDEFMLLQHEYELLDKAYRDGQAGILASTLKDGVACPVCGSTVHPMLARLATDVPTKEELDKARKIADKARQNVSELSVSSGTIKGELSSFEAELKSSVSKLLLTEDLDEVPNRLKTETEKIKYDIEQVTEAIQTEQAKVDRKNELADIIPKSEESLKSISEAIASLNAQIAAAKASVKEKTSQAEELRGKLLFESKKDAQDRIDKLNRQAQILQTAFDKAGKLLADHNDKISRLHGSISGLENSLSEATVIDVMAEKQEQARIRDEQTRLNEQNKQIAARLSTNEKIKTNIQEKSTELESIEKKLQWVSALADTANGKLRGKDKIMLETYIQTTYFDRIINRANLRLLTMSGNQYELKRAKEASDSRSQSGLELSVVDHYNGSERSVKTLSGGESFMASLSLALGLSDEVQSSAGGIKIDTMFVDEGFGTLDTESLDQAYKALVGLTEGNRLVGIISHVGDLKEKIDKQIIVTKGKSGGSLARIQV